MSARTTNLLALPNESLLAIAARMPYSRGDSITTLRLVNKQLEDILSDESNLKQLRNDIAETQFPTAHALRVSKTDTSDHDWLSLQELEDDTTAVDQIIQQLQIPQKDDYSNPASTLAQDLEGLHLGSTSCNEKIRTLHFGLHLFAALSHAGIQALDEEESTYWILSLGVPVVSLLRFTSLEIVKDLRQLFYRGPIYAPTSYYGSIFSSKAPLAMEDLLVENGPKAIAHLLRPHQDVSGDTLSFTKDFAEGVRRLDLTLSYFVYQNEYRRWKINGVASFGPHTHIGRLPSWAIVANSFLVDYMWNHIVIDWDGGCSDKCLGALFKFCCQGGKIGDGDPSDIIDQLDSTLLIRALGKQDWYSFVDQNLEICMSGGRAHWAERHGMSVAIVKAFHAASAKAWRDKSQEAQVPTKLPPHFTYLALKDLWDSRKV